MNRHVLFHCGLDCHGNRHWRLKSTVAVRVSRHHAALFPKVIVVARTVPCRPVWRNGLQQRRCQALATVLRAERRSFLTTLPRPALVPPLTLSLRVNAGRQVFGP